MIKPAKKCINFKERKGWLSAGCCINKWTAALESSILGWLLGYNLPSEINKS